VSEAIEWRTHHIAEDSQACVLTERTDRFKIDGEWRETKVMGIFELEGGKIRHWRDYFDLQQTITALGVG